MCSLSLCSLFSLRALFSLPFLALFAPSSTAKRDGETERYCLLAIANIAVSSENHKEIINRCLDTLIGFSKSSDVRCRQFSMFALGNLASDPQNLDVVMQGGCLKPIVSFAFPGDHNVQVRLYCACWWYSLCNFQYRLQYAHARITLTVVYEHVFFYFYLMCEYNDKYDQYSPCFDFDCFD